MPALQVKDCPAVVYDKLRECASRENRSISQQALTIIEEYLGMRHSSTASLDPNSDAQGLIQASSTLPESTPCGYFANKRKRVFDRIASLPPLPISKKAPNSADILHEAREENER